MAKMAWRGRGRESRGNGAQTKQVTWVVCLVLYLLALAVHFRWFPSLHVQSELGTWAWILGYGLLLLAGKVRGL
jgi:hypothetical protein